MKKRIHNLVKRLNTYINFKFYTLNFRLENKRLPFVRSMSLCLFASAYYVTRKLEAQDPLYRMVLDMFIIPGCVELNKPIKEVGLVKITGKHDDKLQYACYYFKTEDSITLKEVTYELFF